MAYPGKPSRGCETCRSRKVKCDERKPTCLRCENAHKECRGYRDLTALQRMTHRATGRDQPWRVLVYQPDRASSLGPSSDSQQAQARDVNADESMHLPQRLGPALEFTREQRSVPYFFDQFIVASLGDASPGWLEFLPDLYSSAQPHSCLKLAVDAVSHMLMSNQTNDKTLKTLGLQNYVEALQSTNRALISPSEAVQDSTLVAILMLCLCGHVQGDLLAPMGRHADGLERLLELRGRHRLESQRDIDLFRHFRYIMFLEQIMRKQPMSGMVTFVTANIDPKSPSARYAVASFALGELIAEAGKIFSHSDDRDIVGDLMMIVGKGRAIDSRLQDVAVGAEPDWLVREILNRATPDSMNLVGSTISPIYAYRSTWIFSTWCAIRSARLMLNELLIQCYDHLQSCDLLRSGYPALGLIDKRATSLNVIQSMIEGICASIPFALGDVGESDGTANTRTAKAVKGYMFISHMRGVIGCPHATERQIHQARSTMQRIGRQYGILAAGGGADQKASTQPRS